MKEIERAGVRSDYIGETSMDAIVGGLYACGYTAIQREEMLVTTNLTDFINDKFDHDAMSFDAKEDAPRYATTPSIVKWRIQLP